MIGGKMISSLKRHGMVTRKDRCLEHRAHEPVGERSFKEIVEKRRWNLNEEIAKVVEKGIELGVIKGGGGSKRGEQLSVDPSGNLTGNWKLSEEVAKVIEVGVALGFDFQGKEDSISEEIRRRETEDETRFLQN
jgi:hypothetical protein